MNNDHLSAVVPCVIVFATLVLAAEPSRRYLHFDSSAGMWCAYDSERRWRAEAASRGSPITVEVTYHDSRLSAIHVVEQAESGDWVLTDEYMISESGDISSIKRTVSMAAGDFKDIQVYSVNNRKLVLLKAERRSLRDGKRKKRDNAWLPEISLITRMQDFEFSTLLDKQRVPLSGPQVSCLKPRK